MTPTPSITVYVATNNQEAELYVGDVLCDFPDVWVEKKIWPDPSYINAIINDQASATDKIQRLQIYLDTFDNLTKY